MNINYWHIIYGIISIYYIYFFVLRSASTIFPPHVILHPDVLVEKSSSVNKLQDLSHSPIWQNVKFTFTWEHYLYIIHLTLINF